jgi:hypothetical protein
MGEIISVTAQALDGGHVNGLHVDVHGGDHPPEGAADLLIEDPLFEAHGDVGPQLTAGV